MDLRPAEIRVLACLLEKQRTTPDSYPLTLNSLRLACNQATNRDPVVDYDDDTIRDAVHRLERRGLARLASGAGSRAPKFRHLLADRLPLDDAEQALLCVLMLRGPQTPGELKQRADRLHGFADLESVQATLERLIEGDLAMRLHRRPGQKEERYAHLLGEVDEEQGPVGAPEQASTVTPTTSVAPAPEEPSRALATPVPTPPHVGEAAPSPLQGGDAARQSWPQLDELRRRVELLEREVADLRDALGG